MANLLMTGITGGSPVDGSATPAEKEISDFLTLQSLTNFGAMTGGITAAWHALIRLAPHAATLWVPFGFAIGWGVVSVLVSIKAGSFTEKGTGAWDWGGFSVAIFIAVINSLVLFSAVVGVGEAIG